jgi:hypothetical protein
MVIVMSTPHLTDLALDLASDGFGGHEHAVRSVVRSARDRAVCPTLVAILADPRQPEVARLRAFGRVAVALCDVETAPRVRPAA